MRSILAALAAVGSPTPLFAAETVTYSYDAHGRLVTAAGNGPSGTTAISYDAAGNRSTYSVNHGGSGAPTVAGGGFETPEVGTGYAYAPGGGPASFTNNSGITGNGSAWGFAQAPEGNQVAFLQTIAAPAVISLAVSGLTPGSSYKATFYLAVRPGFAANPVTVAFNGVTLGTFSPGSTAFTAVSSAAFTAGASSGTLTFTGANNSADTSTGLDLVAVVPVATSPASVPGGGFETPEVGTGYAYAPGGGPASFANNSGIAGNDSVWGFAHAPEGNQVAFLQTIAAPAVISLSVSGLVPGSSYKANFYLAVRPGFYANPVTVAFNGATLGTFSPGSAAFTAVDSAAFTPAGTTGILTFTGASSSADTSTGLDKVTVTGSGQ